MRVFASFLSQTMFSQEAGFLVSAEKKFHLLRLRMLVLSESQLIELQFFLLDFLSNFYLLIFFLEHLNFHNLI